MNRRQFLGAAASQGLAAALAHGQAAPAPAQARPQSRREPPLRPEQAAAGVLHRLLGPASARFHLAALPSGSNGKPAYTLEASGGEVRIAGTSAVAICRAAYSYLRGQGAVMVCWSGTRIALPDPLPSLAAVRVECPYQHVQYLNPCTYGYTMAFWDWARWERELDWMALHGITMPLAMEGQEWVWNQVWRSFGISQAELDAWNTGPAHLPWHRMGNINGFDGPLPPDWIEKRRALQKQIMDRMRALGMTPVAPAFGGFVPQGFLRVQPDAATTTLLWLPEEFKTIPRSTRTFVLHPRQEALYREIGRRFIERYKAEYGEVSYYLADSFNELDPPVSADRRYEDLEQFGRTVYSSILAGDPAGTWVMQGWLFVFGAQGFWDDASVAALLRGVPDDRMLILDYTNDLEPKPGSKYQPGPWRRTQAFHGKGWVNGMAHTFGGNNTLKGNLPLMAAEPAQTLADPAHGNLQGWGMCPEGIETNEVAYELMTDAGWQREPIQLDTWIAAYCRARYGSYPDAMQEAWALLLKSAYGAHVWMSHAAWQAEPTTEPHAQGVNSGPEFVQAARLFLSCADQLGEGQLYRNDLIELTVQAAGGYVDAQLALAGEQIRSGYLSGAAPHMEAALRTMEQMDALLNLRADRRLETWVAAARAQASAADEAAYYDENARRLITTWGWPELSDYACRAWSGLLRDYYAARWRAWWEHQHAEQAFSLDIWQQTWLSRPWQPSQPMPVADLFAFAGQLLARVS